MNKFQLTLFVVLSLVVALLVVRSIKMQSQMEIAHYNQNEIIKSLIKAGIVQIDEDVQIQ